MTVGLDDFQSKNRAMKNHNLTGMEKQKSLNSVFVEGPFILEIPNAPFMDYLLYVKKRATICRSGEMAIGVNITPSHLGMICQTIKRRTQVTQIE